MAKGHRSQIKRERNEQRDTRPSAKISYARISVQKACYVLDAIRGKDVQTALGILAYNPRYASAVIEKLLKSAIANAENNNGMSVDNLYIEECYANKGPTMKRIRPRAQGRAYRIEKRMSHITIVLNESENNNGMSVDNLYIEECYANKGPTMKRIRPRAQGRAYRIEKRMSHITIVLNER